MPQESKVASLSNREENSKNGSENLNGFQNQVTKDGWQEKKERFRLKKSRHSQEESSDKEADYFKTVFIGQNLTKKYRGQSTDFILSIDELRLKYGEITSLVGENGNGKTTLLRIIAGDLKETAGTVAYPALSGRKGLHNLDYNWIKQKIAYIPQELPRWSGLLVDNLHFSASINGILGKDNQFEVDFIISRLGLDKYRNFTWSEISGGFKMRFALAKALLWNPKILILDEPLANLDINTQMVFLEDLRDIADSTEDPKSIVVSSQHLHEIESISDNLIFLQNGSASYNGSLRDFGKDRTENCFEFVCNLSKSELMDLLEEVDYIRIHVVIHCHYIVTTSRDVSWRMLFKIFSERGIEVSYFRDVSQSTRRLFSHGVSS